MQEQLLVALLREALTFSCWMRLFYSSSAKVFLHPSNRKFSQVDLDGGKARASEALQDGIKSKTGPRRGTPTRCFWPLGVATSEHLAQHKGLEL